MAKVSPGDREKTGFKKEGAKGKYPMATKAQVLSAIRLRHHGHGVSASEVLNKAARSKFGDDSQVKATIQRARERDRKKKK